MFIHIVTRGMYCRSGLRGQTVSWECDGVVGQRTKGIGQNPGASALRIKD